MLPLLIELDMRLIHLDPKYWLPEGFQALEILDALVYLIMEEDVIGLAVVILVIRRRRFLVRGAKGDDFLGKSREDWSLIRIGLLFRLELLVFARFFKVMQVLREKLQRVLIENFQLLVEGEALLGLVRLGRAEEKESLQ
jgi:hypothetical protein